MRRLSQCHDQLTARPFSSTDRSLTPYNSKQLQGAAAGRSSSGLLGEGGAAAYIRRAQSSPGGYSLVNGSALDQQQQVRNEQSRQLSCVLSTC